MEVKMSRCNLFSIRVVLILIYLISFISISKNCYAETIPLEGGKAFEKTDGNRDTSIDLSFDWRMPDRYGLDRNGNGIIDIPNTQDYVYNREFVGCPSVPKDPREERGPGEILDPSRRRPSDLLFNLPYYVPKGSSIFGQIACLATSRLKEAGFIIQLDNSDSKIPYHFFEIGSKDPTKKIINAHNDIALIRGICKPTLGSSDEILEIERVYDENGHLLGINFPASAPCQINPDADLNVSGYMKADVRFVWSISGRDIDYKHIILPFVTKPEKKPREYIAALPEGEYQVEMLLLDLIGNKWNSVSKIVTVKDHLIVALGDSFSSGQGAPEAVYINTKKVYVDSPNNRIKIKKHFRDVLHTTITDAQITASAKHFSDNNKSYIENGFRVWELKPRLGIGAIYPKVYFNPYRKVVWADDGGTSLHYGFIYKDEESVPWSPDGGMRMFLPTRTKHKVHYYNKMIDVSDVVKRHDVYARSSFSHSSQFALKLEKSNDKSSVTYLNLAMAGATYNNGMVSGFNGFMGSPFYKVDNYETDQISLLSNTIGKISDEHARTIDAVILTLGGNDVGFKHIIEGLLGRVSGIVEPVKYCNDLEPGLIMFGPNLCEIRNGFKTGSWGTVENNLGTILQSRFSQMYDWGKLTGLDDLQNRFTNSFWDKLTNYKIAKGKNGKYNIFTFGYPSMGHKCDEFSNDRCLCNSILPAIIAEENGLISYSITGEIELFELKFVRDHILKPLNKEIKSVTQVLNWNYVENVEESSLNHGLCKGKYFSGDLGLGTYLQPSHKILEKSDEDKARSWFREFQEASWLENRTLRNVSLAAHPNELGYKGFMKAYCNVVARNLFLDEWNTCKTLPGIGQPCIQGRCASGLACSENICRSFPREGEPCLSDGRCDGRLVCNNNICRYPPCNDCSGAGCVNGCLRGYDCIRSTGKCIKDTGL